MRTGIEKLQVRIESDERKKQKMGELLKGIVKITSESALLAAFVYTNKEYDFGLSLLFM